MMRLAVCGLISIGPLCGCADAKGESSAASECGTHGQVVWVDANGECVKELITQLGVANKSHNYIDSNGIIWAIDLRTGEIGSVHREDFLYYESADCTGVAYIKAQNPRLTLTVLDDERYRVRPDDMPSVEVAFESVMESSGVCGSLSGTDIRMPLEGTLPSTPLQPPVVPYQLPFHPQVVF